MRFLKLFPLAAALGAALAFLFDPQNGKRRRRLAIDRTAGFLRQTSRRAGRAGRGVAAGTEGMAHKVAHRREEEKPQPDDVTLARKVETEIFRDPGVPKGEINVNAERGIVYLRGEVERVELIDALERATRNVQGVREVENFLHLPGSQPQMRR